MSALGAALQLARAQPVVTTAVCNAIALAARAGQLPVVASESSDTAPRIPPTSACQLVDSIVAATQGQLPLGARAQQLLRAAVEALAALAEAYPDERCVTPVVHALFSMASHSAPEVQHAVGNALARWVARCACAIAAQHLAVNAHCACGSTNCRRSTLASPRCAHAAQPPLEVLVSHVDRQVLRDSRAEVRRAGIMWLVCALSHCGHQWRDALGSHVLPHVHAMLLWALGEPSEATRDAASMGLAQSYAQAPASRQQVLLDDALQAMLKGRRRGMGRDPVGGEDGAAPEWVAYEAPSDCKEFAGMACDLGKPELWYSLLLLSSPLMVRRSSGLRACAARSAHVHALHALLACFACFACFACSAQLWRNGHDGQLDSTAVAAAARARAAVTPYLPRLLPRLFRARFSPSPAVAQAARATWAALVGDGAAALQRQFGTLLPPLLQSVRASSWQERHASMLAVGQLVLGRSAEQLLPHIEELWQVSTKGLDDVHGSVREAAGGTLRTVSNATVRVCDGDDAAVAAQFVSIVVPFLLHNGMVDRAEDGEVTHAARCCRRQC